MEANIFSQEKLIGTATLQIGDRSMGHIYGRFLPNESYFAHVRQKTWRFWSTSRRNKWELLRLNVQLSNGYFLFAVGGITIDDVKGLPDEPLQIDIAGVDSHVIEDFFLAQPSRPFMEEPWEIITITQKIAFEEELNKEVGVDGERWTSLGHSKSTKNCHPLTGFKFSALSTYGPNDDVLFVTRKQGCDETFAIVHLTWRGYIEKPGYPNVEFYKSFDEFKNFRMYPDKADWEY